MLTLPRNDWWAMQGCHCIDRHQRLAKRNVHAESVDTMTVCFASFVSSMSLFLLVVSAEEHAELLRVPGDRITLPFIGSRSDSRFCRRGYF